MVAREFWQWQLRLAFVSIPVEVYPFTIGDAAILLSRSENWALRGWGMAEQSLPDV